MTERDSNQKMIGRYALYAPIASGGMATVHFGRLHAAGGFSRTVAIKRLHSQYASQPEFVDRFLDEARIAARIRHPNVIPTLDVVSRGGEVFLVMEYAHGESLSKLIGRARELGQPVPLRIASAIMTSVLHGLHDAHEARSETGQPLRIVHRDVSPQNVVVGSDGVTRILDFGIAKAVDRAQTTRDGAIRGKVAYMAPEQLLDAGVDRLTDIYAAAVVFWELLTGERIFGDAELVAIASRIMNGEPSPPPSTRRAEIPADLDALIMKGLSHDVADRPQSALAMATEIERIVEPASASRVAEWVQSLAADALKKRARIVAEIESGIVAAEDFGEGGQESEVMLLSDGAIIDSFTAPSIPVVTALDGPPRSKRAPPPLPASRSSRTSRILGISLLFAAPVFIFVGWHLVRTNPTPSAIESSADQKPNAPESSVPLLAQGPTTPSATTSTAATSIASASPTAPVVVATATTTRSHRSGADHAGPTPAASVSVAPPPPDSPDTLYRSRR